MTTELNQKFAEAYGVAAERLQADCSKLKHGSRWRGVYVPINTDTLTLFQLCIEHGFTIKHELLGVFPCVIVTLQVKKLHIYEPENYVAHETKQAATCAAMWAALCKLKNIGSE